jgi:hypothetical protein
LLLAFVAAASVYRAATQGIVYDEAATYLMFVAGPVERVFTWYTANNHVLFTLAANATTGLIGVTELTLRLPSVVAGIGYLLAAALLAARICTRRVVFFLTLCALTLNPLVFDFLSAARGYGLALCLLMAALLELSREPGRQRWVLASLALGGAVCANLAFAFPSVALALTASAIALKGPRRAGLLGPPKSGDAAGRRVVMAKLWLPGISMTAALLALPLRNATLDTFFFGADTLIEAARSVVRLSVQHHPTWWSGTPLATWTETALTYAMIVTAVAASCAGAFWLLRWWRLAPTPLAAPPGALLGGTMALTITLLIVAHTTADVLYPRERTGLYFVPLIVLTLASAADWARSRVVRWAAAGVLCLLTVTAFEQFTTASYGQWRYDAGSRRIAELIASRASSYARAVRVATTEHLYQPALEFYRVTRYPDRLAPVVDGFDPTNTGDIDMVVVTTADAARLPATCRQLYVDAVSGAELRECAREPASGVPAAIATTGSAGVQ